MKSFITLVQKHALGIMSCMALMVTVMNTNRMCYFCFNQPKPPAGMDKYRAHK